MYFFRNLTSIVVEKKQLIIFSFKMSILYQNYNSGKKAINLNYKHFDFKIKMINCFFFSTAILAKILYRKKNMLN